MKEEHVIKIPFKILKNKNLSDNAKILYGEIERLSREFGFCYAQNVYLSDLLQVSERSIRDFISQLKKEKLIKMEFENRGNARIRRIYLWDVES